MDIAAKLYVENASNSHFKGATRHEKRLGHRKYGFLTKRVFKGT